MKSVLNRVYEDLMMSSYWDGDGHDVIDTSVLENKWIELQNGIEEKLGRIRFLRYEDPDIIGKIKKHAKEIKNPWTGGDNDYIIYDTWNGEYCWGELGELPLDDTEILNRDYNDRDLKEIIKFQGSYC